MDKKYIKLIGFNLFLALTDVICLSNGFLGLLSDNTNAFKTALGCMILVMSVLLFFYVNLKILNSKEVVHEFNMNNLETSEDYLKALDLLVSKNKRVFSEDITVAIEQIKRLDRKNDSFKEMFFQKFGEESQGDSYGFEGIMNDTNELLYKNMEKIINTIMIFDYHEYASLVAQSSKNHVSSEKMALMKESIEYVKDTLKKNEKILLNEDKLIIEMSKIGDNEEDDEVNLERINDIVSSMKQLRQGQI